MKKVKQKFFIGLLTISLMLLSEASGQNFSCGTTSGNQTQSAPVVCSQLLNDFIPQSSESDIEVNINIYVFQPTSGPGSWGTPTTGDLNYLMFTANNNFSALQTPKLPVSGVPFLPSSKIKLILKSYQIITDDNIYNNITTAPSYPAYNDPNAIDVYFGNCIGSFCTAFVNGPLPSKFAYFAYGGTQNLWDRGDVLCHEIGHALGLVHTSTPEGFSYATSTFGCCNQLVSNDYTQENLPIAFHGCGDATGSNNMMSQNSGCMKYLSPLQIALINYNLRTAMYNVLTTTSKNYVSTVNTSFDINITSNQTWTADRFLKGNITVKAGNTLTIKCSLLMTKNAKILVEKGAKLVLDAGNITTFFNEFWKGIEIEGTSTQNQNFSGGYGIYQGYVNIINGGKISNADIAINTCTTDVYGNIDWNSTGGIIIANTADFINNRKDVQFLYYHSPNGGNKGSFTRCNFKINSGLNANVLPDSRVSLYEVDGVFFGACSFEYNAGSYYNIYSRGTAINSIDASYTIDQVCNNNINPCSSYTKTQFLNFYRGVYVDNSNPLRVVSIKNSNFYDIINYSTYYNYITTPVFENNYIRTASVGGTGVGLYLNNCKLYNVKNNTFLQNTALYDGGDVGIYVNNSLAGAHKIYRNSFANFDVALGALNNNSGVTNTTDGLKINCNDFTPIANAYDIALMGTSPTVAKTQGNISGMTSANVVRNIYGAVSTGSSAENKWYIQGTSVKTIDHGSNSNANMRPTPQPDNSDVAVNVVNSGISYQPQHCPATESTGGGGGSGGGRLANINSTISNLVSEGVMATAKGISLAENKASFELQAALAEKLNYFLMDSLPQSKDSVIALLQNYPNAIDDADVLLTYAYINKGDFSTAQQNVTAIATKNADWANLQTKLIALHQSPKKAFDLNTNASAKNELQSYADTDGKNGQPAAQALLKFVTGQNYFIPHLLPLVEGGVNKSIQNPLLITEGSIQNTNFSVYPNPANTIVNFIYKGTDELLQITLSNTIGTEVFKASVKANTKFEINLANFETGVYLLTAYNGKLKVYQTKVICIK